MSFVIFAGCQYFGVMIGERRCLSFENKIQNENVKKVRRINKNVVTCAGGSESIINVVWKPLLEHNYKEKLSYEDCVLLCKEKCDSIYDEYEGLYKQNDLSANIGIMGLNKNGQISLNTISFTNGEIKNLITNYVETDDNGFVYFATGINGNLQNIFYDKFMKCPRFTLENLKSIFYQTVHQELKNDISINDRFIMEFIERRDLIERDKIRIDK